MIDDEAQAIAVKEAETELLHVKVRYKDPGASTSKLISQAVLDGKNGLAETSVDFRFASAVAEFALVLRQSPHKGNANFGDLENRARGSLGPDLQGHRAEFLRIVEAARRLDGKD